MAKSKQPSPCTHPKYPAAYNNFLRGMSDSDNHRITGVSRQTIAIWSKKYEWEAKRAALHQQTNDKFIANESSRIAGDLKSLDSSHKSMVRDIGNMYSTILEESKNQTSLTERMANVSWLLNHAAPLIKLERLVTGLDKMGVKRIEFPQMLAVQLQTNKGAITIQANKLTHDVATDLLSVLPNQNESYFGEAPPAGFEEEEEDDEYLIEADDPFDLANQIVNP